MADEAAAAQMTAAGVPEPPPWHALSVEQAIGALRTRPDGLDPEEAAARLRSHGPNVIPRGRSETPLELLWRQIDNPLIWVLIASAGVAMAVDPTGGVKNGLVILAVVVLNTIIGFAQEFKAGKAIESLTRMVPSSSTVMRGGRKFTVPSVDLVPGDVVVLTSGEKVPCDMRLIELRSLLVEEAALTGESVPTEKRLSPVAATAAIGDRVSLVFGGTLVTHGTARAVVFATGATTELGRISALLRETTDLETPLTRALATIGKQISIAIVVIAVLMLVLGTWRAMVETGAAWWPALRETVVFAVAMAVGAIPEGLPAIVTIALAIGVQRMAARRAIVRKLPAVETLGSTTVICSDKTGTLTRNEMTVRQLWTPISGGLSVSGVGYEPTGELQKDDAAAALTADVEALLRAGALCSEATLTRAEGAWRIHGDPTEGALVVAAEKFGIGVERARAQVGLVDSIPFDSENQFMATLHGLDGGRIMLKGAPEAVLRRCSAAAQGAALDRAAVLHEVEQLAAHGLRVLALATKAAPGQTTLELSHVDDGFTLLGLQAMIDPPRPEAITAIEACHRAGIKVKMITGDHKATAVAVAGAIGILRTDDRTPDAIRGTELDVHEQTLSSTARECNVFARVAPEHKLKLVRALQQGNEVVAMTGDGVNDAPALKQANIGVAMGISGTSVAKESAAIVLTDDNFASIAAAVEEGRRVYDNLVKSLAFVLPTNLGLALILIWAVAFFPFADVTQVVDGATVAVRELLLPMAPTQLLWINLVAAVALALPLAFEAKEPDIMNRPPRHARAPVLSRFVIVRTVVVAVLMTAGAIGLFLYAYDPSQPGALARAQTMGVTTVVMFQIFYMLNCRSLRDSVLRIGVFSNKAVFVGIAVVVALQLLFIYLPVMQRIFGSASLRVEDLVASALVGALILPVVGLEKWWRRRPHMAGRQHAASIDSARS